MSRPTLIERLTSVQPGWEEWSRLIDLVQSLQFEYRSEDWGSFYTSGDRLSFAEDEDIPWPDWLPPYVPALYGLKAGNWEAAGGYAGSFDGRPARRGAIFSAAGNDELMGFPLLDVPADLYPFQSNFSGAVFYIDPALNISYPNADDECFQVLDSLEAFTRRNLEQAILGHGWAQAYQGVRGSLLD